MVRIVRLWNARGRFRVESVRSTRKGPNPAIESREERGTHKANHANGFERSLQAGGPRTQEELGATTRVAPTTHTGRVAKITPGCRPVSILSTLVVWMVGASIAVTPSSFSIFHSPFSILHSPFPPFSISPILHFPFSIIHLPHSPFSILHFPHWVAALSGAGLHLGCPAPVVPHLSWLTHKSDSSPDPSRPSCSPKSGYTVGVE